MELLGSRPDYKVILYFLTVICLGTILLSLPVSASSQPIVFIDALFTSTSATCVTGLIVLDTGHDFSLFGQIVIMLLIQLGGLGIMTFATVAILTIESSVDIKDMMLVNKTLGGRRSQNIKSLLAVVLITTFTVESIGAVALFSKFKEQFPTSEAVFHSIFHSVSAFCNAGFSSFSTSLENYSGDLYIIAVFSLLIILGGLGFVVIKELTTIFFQKKSLSLHTKICLSATAILLIAGTVLFLLADYENVLGDMGPIMSTANAFFQSVTCRTAGFNTISQTSLTEVSLLITMILMFIGGCPGSTAGGIKTTTAAVVFILAYRRFGGYRNVNVFNKSLSGDTISRSLTIVLLAAAVIILMFVVLLFAQERPMPHTETAGWFLETFFEVVSAFGTVGLSLGMTSKLTVFGKIIVILLMFTGRVGLLTLVFAMARPQRKGEYMYAEEDIIVG